MIISLLFSISFFNLFNAIFTFLNAAPTKRETLISSSILNASDVTPASAGFGYFDFRLKVKISKMFSLQITKWLIERAFIKIFTVYLEFWETSIIVTQSIASESAFAADRICCFSELEKLESIKNGTFK